MNRNRYDLFPTVMELLTTALSYSACVDPYLIALCKGDPGAFSGSWHSSGLRLSLTSSGIVAKLGTDLVVSHSRAAMKPVKEGYLLSLTIISDT